MIDGVSAGSLFQATRRASLRGQGTESASGAEQPTTEEQEQINKLRTVDQRVRSHEQAHVTAGGPHAGSPQYEFTRGPDNRNYAVSGEVPIDASPERDPDATIRKMEIVKRAALAPPDPSPQDLRVAQQADAIATQAQAEKSREEQKDAGERKAGAAGVTAEGDGAAAAGAAAGGAATVRGLAAYGAAASLVATATAPRFSITA